MLDKRNVSPKMTPDWTPEKLDEFGKSRGRALAWARRAKMGEFVGDPYETLDLPMEFRVYAIVSSFLVAFAFGRATPNLLFRNSTFNRQRWNFCKCLLWLCF